MTPPVSVKLMYNISLFPASEGKKDLKKCVGTNMYLKLDSDEPFDTWKAQLLVKIEKTFNPPRLDFDAYTITFSVPRIQPSAIALTSTEDYDLMLKRTQKNRDSTASIYVQEKSKSKVSWILLV